MSQRVQTFSLDGADWQLLHLMPREWESRKVWEEEWKPEGGFPAIDNWLRGTVPGDVISDAWAAGLISDPYIDMNSRACEWLSERDWVYRKDFAAPDLTPGERLRLCFEGVDFVGRVYLNGDLLGEHAGMFTPFEFDITEQVRRDKPNRLLIIVMHAPHVDIVQGQVGRTSTARLWKARFAYAWDWCTRLIPVGIWRSVKLVRTGPVVLRDVWVRPLVDAAKGTAELQVHADADGATLHVSVTFDGNKVATAEGKSGLKVTIPDPQLWWPNGMGAQPLYDVKVSAIAGGSVSDIYHTQVGLRTIRMVQNEGAPKGALPYTFEVNGKRLFARGWNWVPVDHMYGRDQGTAAAPIHPVADRYARLTEIAAHAHCNLLRVWGGGLLESEKFYDACDRLGILVWQEFPQSSSGIDNRPPADDAYVAYITKEARQMVPLRRNHACLAAWCGGNELMDDDYLPLTDSHPALGALKAVVKELDPDRGWLPASPSGPEWSVSREKGGTGLMHDVHGPWKYDGPEGHYSLYNQIDPLLHSEFGVEGSANLDTLKRYLSEKHLWPPTEANPAWVHHGSWWLHLPMIESLFGPTDNLEDFVRASQWMHAEGLRYAVEAHRRRTGYCSGVIPWQFNEAYPNAACTNVVDYLLQLKPAYWWIRQAYAPVSISLKYDKLTWKPGEEWRAEAWAVGSYEDRPGCTWTANIFTLTGERLAAAEGKVDLVPDKPVQLTEFIEALPPESGIILVFLCIQAKDGTHLASNDYLFSTDTPPLRALRTAPRTTLRVRREGGQLILENQGPAPALMVSVQSKAGALPARGYFSLPPGGRQAFAGNADPADFTVSAWNADGVE